MRTQHTVPIATPQARVWEIVEQPPSSLLWLADPSDHLATLMGRDFTSGAKHELIERRRDDEHRWLITVLLRQAPHGIDVGFDRGDLRLIVRQRLRTRHGHLTEWACRFEAYPQRTATYPLALYLRGAVKGRLRRRMRLVRENLERINDRALATSTGATPPARGAAIDPGLEPST